ncbi:MAG TPA: DUF1707 domain-containing protein [Trebonia sp.]|jgi:hypothetical protein|nr:DUF1707 domain-containing protein [Trebonia sp.]
MASDNSIRASDVDREVVVATLRDAYTAGRLTLEEFDERTSAAYASKTWGDLRKLTEDLPSQPVLGSDVPGRRLPPATLPSASLPSHPERNNGAIPPVRHRPRAIAFLPIVTLWLVLALASRSAHDIVAPTVVLVMTIALLSFGRRRLNHIALGP